ncbi:selenide, water dikinase [Xenorhabdus eapokensis]|uniref:Selenide, water dikinase n=1 Tax=Xenorhabdus eapokensis TaxID=1873482 RepID=A0A1Q5TSN1_9GAMM|nr:selenide, water dikinase [Xenorhabdus eapokensis]
MSTEIRLIQYSHGAGCDCKILPKVSNLDTKVLRKKLCAS